MAIAAKIRQFGLFKNCSTEFIQTLSATAQQKQAAKGLAILLEGMINDRLLILVSGQVEVRVNKERVAILETPGDLMGEISALTLRSVTASLHALTDVEYLEIPASSIEAVPAGDLFRYELYRLLSEVLSDKITHTNEKARQFEIANRSLVDINRTLDQKVQERTDATFKKLSELQSALAPLVDVLKNGGAAHERASEQLRTSIDTIRSMSEAYSSERAIRSRRVLIAEPDRKQQTIARMALGGTGVQLETVASGEEALAAAQGAKPFDLIFLSSALSSIVPEFARQGLAGQLVIMASSDLKAELPVLKTHAGVVSHIVSRNPEDRLFTVKNIATTVTKLISRDLFGLEKYMIWGVETQERVIDTSANRAGLIEEMQQHFKSLGLRGTVTDRAATVAEELLMNAIYDAPVGDDGRHHYAHLDRKVDVNLKSSEQGQFRFACDGMIAAISVSDPFGGLKVNVLLDYLERNLASNGTVVQDEGKGGAGRGLHQIIENSDLVVFNVQPGSKTEVIACFNLDPNAKSSESHPFHFFKG